MEKWRKWRKYSCCLDFFGEVGPIRITNTVSCNQSHERNNKQTVTNIPKKVNRAAHQSSRSKKTWPDIWPPMAPIFVHKRLFDAKEAAKLSQIADQIAGIFGFE